MNKGYRGLKETVVQGMVVNRGAKRRRGKEDRSEGRWKSVDHNRSWERETNNNKVFLVKYEGLSVGL